MSKDEALVQPQQEPVAWEGKTKNGFPAGSHKLIFTDKVRADEWLSEFVEGHAWLEPLYTSPPEYRQPLTDADIRRIAGDAGLEPSEVSGEVFYAMRCVAEEAAHGIGVNK